MSSGSGLSREVLRWLQSLDLSFSIRNVRNDFTNGYLVAEIYSRYYPKDVDIVTFHNGAGKDCKNDNWYQLMKLFKRIDMPFDQIIVNEIIHRKEGSAARFVTESYELLTGKKVAPLKQKPNNNPLPQFARPTVSNLIKQTLKQPDMLHIQDERTRESKAMEVVQMHNSKILNEKRKQRSIGAGSQISEFSNNPSERGSFLPSKSFMKQESQIKPSIQEPSITVKNVQVKQLTSDTAGIRAKRELSGIPPVSVGSYSPKSARDDASGESLLDVINQSVHYYVENTELNIDLRGSAKPLQDIIEIIVNDSLMAKKFLSYEPRLSDSEAACVFDDVAACIDSFPGVCQSSEFWDVSNVFLTIMEIVPETSELYDSSCIGLGKFGNLMIALVESQRLAIGFRELLDVAFDSMLPRLSQLLTNSSAKRHSILSALGCFTNTQPANRIYMIKKLHDGLPEKQLFLLCLTILIFMEENLDVSTGANLLDLYAYYSIIGVSDKSPFIRAASLAMFAVLVQLDPASVGRLLDCMTKLSRDDWWEVQGQLIIVSAKILDVLDLTTALDDKNRYIDQTLQILLDIFTYDAPIKIRKLGLSYLGHHTCRSKMLSERYVEILLDLTRRSVLEGGEYSMDILLSNSEQSEELPVGSACGGSYHLPPLPATWSPVAIANELLSYAHRHQLQNLESWHFGILAALVDSPELNEPEQKSEEKAEVKEEMAEISVYLYENYKFYVFIALCDPNNVSFATHLVQKWIWDFPVLSEDSFYASLKLVYSQSSDDTTCQQHVTDLLTNFIGDERFHAESKELVSNMSVKNPHLLENQFFAQLEALL